MSKLTKSQQQKRDKLREIYRSAKKQSKEAHDLTPVKVLADSKEVELAYLEAENYEKEQAKNSQSRLAALTDNNEEYRKLKNAHSAEYYKNNIEKFTEYRKVYNKTNSTKIKKLRKEYHEANVEKRKAYSKEYYQNNKEKVKEYYRIYNITYKKPKKTQLSQGN